jgi:hypothetical protein
MAIPPVPVDRLLVPDSPTAVPAGFEPVHAQIRGALPFPIDLGSSGSLLLVAATGHAVRWRDADPDEVVSAATRPGVPALLLYRRDGEIRGLTPLIAGRRALLPSAAPVVELIVLDWELRAGNLRGPGDFGSHLRIAWRSVPRGTDRFSPPLLHAQVVRRG